MNRDFALARAARAIQAAYPDQADEILDALCRPSSDYTVPGSGQPELRFQWRSFGNILGEFSIPLAMGWNQHLELRGLRAPRDFDERHWRDFLYSTDLRVTAWGDKALIR